MRPSSSGGSMRPRANRSALFPAFFSLRSTGNRPEVTRRDARSLNRNRRNQLDNNEIRTPGLAKRRGAHGTRRARSSTRGASRACPRHPRRRSFRCRASGSRATGAPRGECQMPAARAVEALLTHNVPASLSTSLSQDLQLRGVPHAHELPRRRHLQSVPRTTRPRVPVQRRRAPERSPRREGGPAPHVGPAHGQGSPVRQVPDDARVEVRDRVGAEPEVQGGEVYTREGARRVRVVRGERSEIDRMRLS